MATDPSFPSLPAKANEGKDELPPHQRYKQLISTLPLNEGWSPLHLRKYQGFWFPELYLPGAMAIQDHFKPRTTDILLVSPPKCGTTWLKGLAYAAVTRKDYPSAQHPLRTRNPHDCVPFMEADLRFDRPSKQDALPPPRLMATHMPYSLLPESVRSSDCRIVYIGRDPKDALVSGWHFIKELTPGTMEPVPFVSAFELSCKGISACGPVWDHFLEYWRESLRKPAKVLFLKYENMTEKPVVNLKRLAEFVGVPFSQEEEEEGVVEEIVRMCSFEKLSNVERNKGHRGAKHLFMKNTSFFRKGKVGDWRNHLTPEMAQRLDRITEEKLRGSGLSFDNVNLQATGGEGNPCT